MSEEILVGGISCFETASGLAVTESSGSRISPSHLISINFFSLVNT